jgi:hypothetical protein
MQKTPWRAWHASWHSLLTMACSKKLGERKASELQRESPNRPMQPTAGRFETYKVEIRK